MPLFEYGKLCFGSGKWEFNGVLIHTEEMGALNDLGREGWELATSYLSPNNLPVHMFRREVATEE